MKGLIAFVVAALVAFIGYRIYDSKQAPVKTFETFATAVARGDYAEADRYASGSVTDKEAGERYRIVGWVPVQDLRSVSYKVTSETRKGDDVELAVTQTVGFNPPGVESAMRSAMHATFAQTATLRKSGGEWKVIAFTNDFKGAE